jgi:hypothetical protein
MSGQFSYNVQAVPAWLEAATKAVAERAAAISGERHIPYNRERLAPASADIKRAHELGRTNIGNYMPALEGATAMANRASQDIHSDIDRYVNPYQRHVVSQLRDESGRHFRENILPYLESQFVRAGQHGGTQHRRYLARAAKESQAELSKAQHKALAHGYEQAAQHQLSDKNRMLASAKMMQDLSRARQISALGDVAQLEGQGAYSQEMDQKSRDLQYENYLRELSYPVARLSEYSSFLHGIPHTIVRSGYGHRSEAAAPEPMMTRMNTLGQLGSLAGQLFAAGMGRGR